MKKVTILALICFFTTSGIVFATGPGEMAQLKIPGGKWWRMPEVVKKLVLTSEEQQKLDDQFVQSRRRMIDLKSNVKKEELELAIILDQKNFDESACMAQYKKLDSARDKLSNERFRFLVEVRKLLGLDRYRQLKTEFRNRRMHQMNKQQERKRPMKGKMIQE